ncbi:MAG TPA: T9SS-dependent M36 family metallopeptidase, partial [Brumimicrobium sp.]|nr:T9SS-dependent M36 family metallopeptidase [Brumimicrobium sp.]
LTQKYDALFVHNAISVVAIKDQKAFFTSNGFIPELSEKVETSSATIAAKDAILSGAKSLGLKISGEIIEQEKKEENHYIFTAKGISKEDINVRLKLFQTSDQTVRAVWDLDIYQLDQKHWWHIRVDAQTGELLDRIDWVSQCDVGSGSNSHAGHKHTKAEFSNAGAPSSSLFGAGYNVFAIPVESPNHGSRSLVIDPENLAASPFGWHDVDGVSGVEFTQTFGNNVYASEDRNDDNMVGYAPDGGSSLDFNFPLNLNQHPQLNEDAAITNLFYMNNIMHDVWYQYGFDEASGNFQQNNYGNGGLGNDHVYAQAQDGGGTNNANFATPPDGNSPRMQMYLWSAASPNYLTVNSPSSVSGPYNSVPAGFGPPIPSTPITEDLVLYDDNTANPTEACSPAVNGSAINGKIAVIRRGNCSFVNKVANAEAAGAVAVIIINNVAGAPFAMGGTDPGIGIPSVMISMADGADLIAEIQLGSTVNATLQTTAANVPLDGDFDNVIIAHEYGHGISNRLTGGASSSGCLSNEEQMGEGWSDWFGLMLTIEPGDQQADARGIGTYASGELPSGGGIRPRPYSTDFSINNITYSATNNTGSISRPHGIGFVWATMLWDLTWALVDKHGMDPDVYNGTGGNNIAMHLVVQGLKLQGCNPGFIDGRDAIIQADQLLYGGENTCLIWEVFANRGLGHSASQGSAASRTDQIEAFDLPPYIGSTSSTQTVASCGNFLWTANNQTYTSSGSYNEYLLNSNGCDSIVTLNLTVNTPASSAITEVACDNYTWSANNQSYASSGVYTEILNTVNGCDSIVTLNLTINTPASSAITEEVCDNYTWSANNQSYASSGVYTEILNTVNGCDSIVTLNLTVNSPASSAITEEVCGNYTWSANNQSYASSGVYTEILNTVNGCDSIVTLNLTVNNPASSAITEEVCGSYTWSANNQSYASSGVYTEILNTVNGCDSIVTLNLTVNSPASSAITEEVCNNYTWSANNQTYSSSGVYTETLSTINGCDSIVTLNLTVNNQPTFSSTTEEVCSNYVWSANGQTYSNSGVYTETLSTIHGCDSIVTLNLTVGSSVSTSVYENTCDNFTWSANNQTYTTSGIYTETLSTGNNCDSIVTLHLTVNNPASSSTTEEVCGNYTWSANGQTYANSGIYTETLSTVNGCDSIVTLDLTVENINAGIIINFDEKTLVSTPGYSSYQWVDCDNGFAPIPGEVSSTYAPVENGSYAVIINEGTCSDTSACTTINIMDINDESKNNLKIYPNPTNGMVNIDFMGNSIQSTIKVFDMTGKLVQEFKVDNQQQFHFFLKGESGIYVLEISSNSGIVQRTRLSKLH